MAKKNHKASPPLPLLFLNGTGCDKRMMVRIAPQLGDREIIHAPMAGTRSAADQAQLILKTAPEKFALAGFSLGAIVAFEILAQASNRVDRLLLINANPRPDREENAQIRRQAVTNMAQSGGGAFINPNWPLQVAAVNLTNQKLQDLVIDMTNRVGVEALADQAEIAINRADNRQRLREINIPVTIIYGAQDQICPPDIRAECKAAFKKITFIEVENAGHFALLEQPQIMASHFKRWLENQL